MSLQGKPVRNGLVGYGGSLLAVGLLTLPLWLLRADLSWSNVSLAYVLLVLALGIWLGTGPSLAAAIASFVLSEYFLLEPLYSLRVADPREFLDLTVYLIAGTVAGQLGAYARRQAHMAHRRAEEQTLLHALSSSLNSVVDRDEVHRVLERFLRGQLGVVGFEILPDGPPIDRTADSQATSYLALAIGAAVFGAVQVTFSAIPTEEQTRLLAACVVQAALALQRIDLTEQAERGLAFQEADRLKTALLHAVSHDFRTPLTIIKTSASNIGALHQRLSEEELVELLEGIEVASDQLDRMVGDLLDVSRLKAGVLSLHEEWTSLAEIAGDVAARVWQLHQEKRIVLAFPMDMPLVRCDYGLILQALGNLVENSLRFEPRDSNIEIRGDYLPGEARVAVVNHGPGIPASERERIMEPFYHEGEGHLGLGLTIAKGIVEAHKGRLWVEDTPDGGATFVLALPREPLEIASDADPGRG